MLVLITSVSLAAPPMEKLSISGDHACALDAEHHLWCWGDRVPASVPFARIQDVETSDRMDCAFQRYEDGYGVYCWGPAAVEPFNVRGAPEGIDVGAGTICTSDPVHCRGEHALPVDEATVGAIWLSDTHACVLDRDESRACFAWDGAPMQAPAAEGHLIVDDGVTCTTWHGSVTCSGPNAPELSPKLGVTFFDVGGGGNACWSGAKGLGCTGEATRHWSKPPKGLSGEVVVGRTGACLRDQGLPLSCWGAPESPLTTLPVAPVPVVVPEKKFGWSGLLIISTAEALRIEALKCEWPIDPGGGRIDDLGAALVAQRSALVACAPSGGAARVSFSFADGVPNSGPSMGDPDVARCIDTAIRGATFMGTGMCVGTLLVGEREGAEAAANAIPDLIRSPF